MKKIVHAALASTTMMWAGLAFATTEVPPTSETPATETAPATTPASEPAATPAPAPESSMTATIDQAPTTPRGIKRGSWYIGIGLGVGMSSLADDAIAGGLAGVTSFRAGAILNDQLLVGAQMSLTGQFNKWAESEPTGSALSNVMGEAMYFPLPHLPWNVAAGLGWGSALKVGRLADNGDSVRVVTESGNGVSWMAGTGWDFFAGEGFNLGLQARYDGTTSGNIGASHAGTLNVWFNWY